MEKVSRWQDEIHCHGDWARKILWFHVFRLSFNFQFAWRLSLSLSLVLGEGDDSINIRVGFGLFMIYFGMAYLPIDRLVNKFLGWSKACERQYEIELGLIHTGIRIHTDDIGWRDNCWKGFKLSFWPEDWIRGHWKQPYMLSMDTVNVPVTFKFKNDVSYKTNATVACRKMKCEHNRPWGKPQYYDEFQMYLDKEALAHTAGFIVIDFPIRAKTLSYFYDEIRGFGEESRSLEAIVIG